MRFVAELFLGKIVVKKLLEKLVKVKRSENGSVIRVEGERFKVQCCR